MSAGWRRTLAATPLMLPHNAVRKADVLLFREHAILLKWPIRETPCLQPSRTGWDGSPVRAGDVRRGNPVGDSTPYQVVQPDQGHENP
jgi:hypothetical protein